MIHGAIYNSRPLIPLTIGWNSKTQEVTALVDTGFTGELKISLKDAVELGIETTHTELITLADENTVGMFAGLAQVSMEGAQKTMEVLISDGMPIIGVGLLKKFGYILTVNFPASLVSLKK
ncbi:MAG: hypothetical protein A2908_04400 [Candidatus Staskawiczbacteria bacterium RIFCSPLOWO2_01_FULL_38_12b]|uniref:Clan AA aspartic protease n=1 Tax=Candidatus Staskawiczbacteria bacterium RIFCSPLOWO2_01_FULL_38_12b TaxID=1802214 RepID=A0A1G2IBK9_9BACT|nr:MAG: hypothetical protein A2908_04400 [Candidatus Staskawiczbacteria bacterium RIFCSPLOWO2_01_FULL_38_12b]